MARELNPAERRTLIVVTAVATPLVVGKLVKEYIRMRLTDGIVCDMAESRLDATSSFALFFQLFTKPELRALISSPEGDACFAYVESPQ